MHQKWKDTVTNNHITHYALTLRITYIKCVFVYLIYKISCTASYTSLQIPELINEVVMISENKFSSCI